MDPLGFSDGSTQSSSRRKRKLSSENTTGSQSRSVNVKQMPIINLEDSTNSLRLENLPGHFSLFSRKPGIPQNILFEHFCWKKANLSIPIGAQDLNFSRSMSEISALCSRGKIRHLNQDRGFVSLVGGKYLSFGVFDGHGTFGHIAAEIAASHFTSALDHQLRMHQNSVKVAMMAASSDIHEICAKNSEMLVDLKNFDKISAECGTTAIVVLVTGQTFYIGGVGDSTCRIYCRQPDSSKNNWSFEGEPIAPHRVEEASDSERERIRTVSGSTLSPASRTIVSKSGVSLRMTRALGHVLLEEAGVSHMMDVEERKFSRRRETILICGSDGFWDEIDLSCGPKYVENLLESCKGELDLVNASLMEKFSSDLRMSDNMVVICAKFSKAELPR